MQIMKIKLPETVYKKKIPALLLLLLFIVLSKEILTHGVLAANLAFNGLNLWFLKMIPALLPFMILSGILIRLNLSGNFASLFSPILKPLFRLSDHCQYVMIIGFLCGFPMGARVCAESLKKGLITRREAELLLIFCNNIGPVYFTGYVLGLFPLKMLWIGFVGMYGLPLLYGLFLRHTLYRNIPYSISKKQSSDLPVFSLETLLEKVNESIMNGLDSITLLGGYMVFCSLLNLLPMLYLDQFPQLIRISGCFLEITSGLAGLLPKEALFAYVLLHFGGLSCIAQTYSMIRGTSLSVRNYVFHKIIQTILAAAFYEIFMAA